LSPGSEASLVRLNQSSVGRWKLNFVYDLAPWLSGVIDTFESYSVIIIDKSWLSGTITVPPESPFTTLTLLLTS
jgi:hypothetical protein